MVLPEEVPRLKQAAVALLASGLLLVISALVLRPVASLDGPRFPPLAIGGSVVSLVAALGALAVLRSPTSPAARRLAFLGSLPIVFALVPLLLIVTVVVDQAVLADYVAYVVLVVMTVGAVWAMYVLWPMVQLDSGTSSGNRPHALSGATSSTPSS